MSLDAMSLAAMSLAAMSLAAMSLDAASVAAHLAATAFGASVLIAEISLRTAADPVGVPAFELHYPHLAEGVIALPRVGSGVVWPVLPGVGGQKRGERTRREIVSFAQRGSTMPFPGDPSLCPRRGGGRRGAG
ncbi:hypothetical protein GCM10023320_40250 [Pseudonocardia adelaidensis]|uniref:Nitroreductase family protein n=1 Tax=Pseudonocardia adelaidensis TaxID=648754 RepID=A0ABP9NL70_9PSEU